MRCRGRVLLLLALLLLPAGLGNGTATPPPNGSLLPAPTEGIPVGRAALTEGIPVGRAALTEGIPVQRDATLGLMASTTVSVTQTPAGAAAWEGGSAVPTAAVTGTGPSSASSAGWEPPAPGRTLGSQSSLPAATPTGGVVEEPPVAPSVLASTLPQAGVPAPLSPTTASSSAAPQPGSSPPHTSPPPSSPAQGTPATTIAAPGPPLSDVTADKTVPDTGVTAQKLPRALSSSSIVAITLTVIMTVMLVFGVAAYLKIRHSSYGRLWDSHDYGSWGSYNNPLYDDS